MTERELTVLRRLTEQHGGLAEAALALLAECDRQSECERAMVGCVNSWMERAEKAEAERDALKAQSKAAEKRIENCHD